MAIYRLLLPAIFLMGCHQPQRADTRFGPSTMIPGHRWTQKVEPTVHVLVALCDNKYQGIVPVPARIGNGDDPVNNLYWGSSFGVKSFFRAQKDWKLVSSMAKPQPEILERVVFKHRTKNLYLVADAYQGRQIQLATTKLLEYAGGRGYEPTTSVGSKHLGLGSQAKLLAYIGHDGLMDFRLPMTPVGADQRHRDVAIFACKSKQFFGPHLMQTGAKPLVWTTNLMCPEAYVLKATIDGWMAKESGSQIRERVAVAYNKYQRCGIKGARNTFATGW